jgi:penicillin-binding protein 2
MKWRKRQSSDLGIFGHVEQGAHWQLPDHGDGAVEHMILGPERERSRWASMQSPVFVGRWRLGVFFLIVLMGTLVGRTAYLQVVQGGYYRHIAESNRTRLNILPSHRGVITDRNGLELAQNTPNFRLLAWAKDIPNWPSDLPDDPANREQVLQQSLDSAVQVVATALEISDQDIYAALVAADPDEPVLLAEDLSYDQALAFLANNQIYPGFHIEFSEKRRYYTNAIPTLSHVLGYTGPVTDEEYKVLSKDGYRRFDSVGKQGLEAAYESVLRGQYGEEVIEVDAQGHALRVISRREAVDGQNLQLALDAQLQAYIEVALEERLRTAPTQRAAVIVMNPKHGEILAMVSAPGFDANSFTHGISSEAYAALINDPNAPLFPRAHAGEYPAGSTIKPVFAAAALASSVITPQTTFLSTGGVTLGDRFFPDWRPGGHGITDVYHAIADSVNTFFYMIGGGNEAFPGMGLEKLMSAALQFGYGQKSGLDLPGEADGFLPSKAWKESAKGEPWYIGDTYNVSIGQGDLLVTPLQVTRATAVFANGGYLVTPHFVLGQNEDTQKILETDIVSVVRDGMRQTVTNGSARSLQAIPVSVAGKTGTAQWSHNYAPHSWFTGFAPYDNPEIVITVLVEQGGDETAALPISRDILQWYFANRKAVDNP